MAITLDHTIVPARDKVASAKYFANLFGLSYDGPMGPFAPVRVNSTLTMDFDDRWPNFEFHHYAFHVSDREFDEIFGRIKEQGLAYGSKPWALGDMKVDESSDGSRVVYFFDLVNHVLEIRTKPSAVEMAERV